MVGTKSVSNHRRMKCEIERFLSIVIGDTLAIWPEKWYKRTGSSSEQSQFRNAFEQFRSLSNILKKWKITFFSKRNQINSKSYWATSNFLCVVLYRRQNKAKALFCAAEKNTKFFKYSSETSR